MGVYNTVHAVKSTMLYMCVCTCTYTVYIISLFPRTHTHTYMYTHTHTHTHTVFSETAAAKFNNLGEAQQQVSILACTGEAYMYTHILMLCAMQF